MNSSISLVKKAVIIFETGYGNTERIAKALAKGIRKSGMETTCYNINDLQIGTLVECEFIAIGAPTQYRTASEPMKRFLEKVEKVDLRGKYGFAFDTRVDSFWAGSAAEFIEKKLKSLGLQIVRPRSSAMVRHADEEGKESKEAGSGESREERKARRAQEKEERRSKVVLEEGMEELFENIGEEIGQILASKTR